MRTLAEQAYENAVVDGDASGTPRVGDTPDAATALTVLRDAGTGAVNTAASLGGSLAPASSPASIGSSPVSHFPYGGVDTFTDHVNDVGEVVRADHFNRITATLRALEAHTRHVLRTGPIDVASRLDNGQRLLFP